jgi:hypothetical protein
MVMKQIWPYISVAALFTVFVAWNGGVVLGTLSFALFPYNGLL